MQPRHVRIVAALSALAWLTFPGFGYLDLIGAWDYGSVLEASWGIFFSVIVAVPFIWVAVRPVLAAPAIAQLWVALAALVVAAVVSLEAPVLLHIVLLGFGVALVSLTEEAERWMPRDLAPNWPVLAVAAAGAVPWLVHAYEMADLNRQELPDQSLTGAVDHYSVQAAFALGVLALATLAGVWSRGRRLLATCAGISAAYVGVVAWAFPDAEGGMATGWAAAMTAWGLVLTVCAWLPRRELARPRGRLG
ncbi:MAG TPA: hypothetical protein VNP92_10265 [Actinophytocola sp.]|nr:hypothetical protein [Actinophytocola sp.]